MIPPNYIETHWKEYRKKVLPDDISQIQYDESRRCFIAGFFVAFKTLTESTSKLDEDNAMIFLDQLQKDLDQIMAKEILNDDVEGYSKH